YFEISRHAIEMTEKMKDILKAHGLHFYIASPTNQQFVVLEDSLLKKLKEKVAVSFWEKADETHTVVRFAASWSTTDEDLRKLDAILYSILEEDKK
ncbi:MAG: low specificity L-threonine aldolase, partial [Lachnospiraceae bacterium]|nr:low specificity L-threonine aldolase [Lachnospiraceae bacterium]